MTDIKCAIVTTHLSPLSRHALLMWVLLYAQEHPEWAKEGKRRLTQGPRH